ncbi:hypothetical protein IWX90DRAFT_100001 [Phyllosticta citrichinensis]|uniref:Transmembrane protein n=1 Tax=Phyllosticta citrichinensis TaxID=1130410 RepID=A0ABR1Y2A9_9PEZI
MPTLALPPREPIAGWKTYTRSSLSASPIVLAITRPSETYTSSLLRDSSPPITTTAAVVEPTQSPQTANHPSRTGLVVAVLFSVLALSLIILLLFYCCRQPRRQPKTWVESTSTSPSPTPFPDPVPSPAPPVGHSPDAAVHGNRSEDGSARTRGPNRNPPRSNQEDNSRPTEGIAAPEPPQLPVLNSTPLGGHTNAPLARGSFNQVPPTPPIPNLPSHGRGTTTERGENQRSQASAPSFERAPASKRKSNVQGTRSFASAVPIPPTQVEPVSNHGVASTQTQSNLHTAASTTAKTPQASSQGMNAENPSTLSTVPGRARQNVATQQAPKISRSVPLESKLGGRCERKTNGQSSKTGIPEGEMPAEKKSSQAHPDESETLVVEEPSSHTPAQSVAERSGPKSAAPTDKKSVQSSPARSETSARKDEQEQVPEDPDPRDIPKGTASIQASSRSPSSAQSSSSCKSRSSRGKKSVARSRNSAGSKNSDGSKSHKAGTSPPQLPSQEPSVRIESGEDYTAVEQDSGSARLSSPAQSARSGPSSRSRSSQARSAKEEPIDGTQEQTSVPFHQSPESTSEITTQSTSVDSTGRVFVDAPEVPDAHEPSAHQRRVIRIRLDERAPQPRLADPSGLFARPGGGRSLWTLPRLEVEDRSGLNSARPEAWRRRRAQRPARHMGNLDAEIEGVHVQGMTDEEMFARLDRLNYLAGRTGGRIMRRETARTAP